MKDILIPVKEGEPNEQLRYTLRSLKNIPHGKVYIAGYKPSWVKNVRHIPVNQRFGTRFQKSANNIFYGCKSDISQEFILMNDDFFITAKPKEIINYHWSTLQDHLNRYGSRRSQYLNIMRTTQTKLTQLGCTTYSYELHCPMVIDKTKFIETYIFMQRKNIPFGSTRSVYGNMHKIESKNRKKDVKIYEPTGKLPKPFCSTTHKVWEHVQPMLDEIFPDKSEFET